MHSPTCSAYCAVQHCVWRDCTKPALHGRKTCSDEHAAEIRRVGNRRAELTHTKNEELTLTRDLYRELRRAAPSAARVKALKSRLDKVREHRKELLQRLREEGVLT